jgi:hypothetical protein
MNIDLLSERSRNCAASAISLRTCCHNFESCVCLRRDLLVLHSAHMLSPFEWCASKGSKQNRAYRASNSRRRILLMIDSYCFTQHDTAYPARPTPRCQRAVRIVSLRSYRATKGSGVLVFAYKESARKRVLLGIHCNCSS